MREGADRVRIAKRIGEADHHLSGSQRLGLERNGSHLQKDVGGGEHGVA